MYTIEVSKQIFRNSKYYKILTIDAPTWDTIPYDYANSQRIIFLDKESSRLLGNFYIQHTADGYKIKDGIDGYTEILACSLYSKETFDIHIEVIKMVAQSYNDFIKKRKLELMNWQGMETFKF